MNKLIFGKSNIISPTTRSCVRFRFRKTRTSKKSVFNNSAHFETELSPWLLVRLIALLDSR